MNEMIINYNTISPHRQSWRDRAQLVGASISIFVGYSETFASYTGISIILPIIGFIIAFVNVLFARFYQKFRDKYGDKFEILLLRINGIIMLITGMGYHVLGSKHIQYAYYFLAVAFFIFLPSVVLPAKKNKLFLKITPSQITIHKLVKSVSHAWQNVDSLFLGDGILLLKLNNRKKSKKFYIEQVQNLPRAKLIDYINKLKSENKYSFKISVI